MPACWPGIQDYMQSDYQTLYPDPSWKNTNLSEVQSAWYERTITIPQDWAGRRVALDVEYLNSYAAVYVDGRKVGEIRFPGGQVDLSAAVRPGATHVLSLLVVAMPLKAVMESYNDTNTAKTEEGRSRTPRPVRRRLADRRAGWGATLRRQDRHFVPPEPDHVSRPGCRGWRPTGATKLRARISDQGRQVAEFTGPTFPAQRCERRPRGVHGVVEAAEAVGHQHAPEPICRRVVTPRRGRPGGGHRDAGSVRVPGVLDSGP